MSGTSTTGTPVTALMLTPVADAQILAAIGRLAKARVRTVMTPSGALAVPEGAGEEEFARVLGGLTRMLQGTPVVAFRYEQGMITAEQWQEGQRIKDLPPGVALDGAPHEIEQLLVQQKPWADLPKTYASSDIGRFKAARMITKLRREQQKRAEQQRGQQQGEQ